jgi:hypothetical protein
MDSQTFLNLKMHAWCDWGEWHQVYQLIFENKNYKKALHLLNRWLSKNVGSADHTKALKMQKLIIVEFLANERFQRCN